MPIHLSLLRPSLKWFLPCWNWYFPTYLLQKIYQGYDSHFFCVAHSPPLCSTWKATSLVCTSLKISLLKLNQNIRACARARKRRRRGGGWTGVVPVTTIATTTDTMIWRHRPHSRGGGRMSCPPSQDLMRSNVERNFWMPSSSGDVIVSCRLLW